LLLHLRKASGCDRNDRSLQMKACDAVEPEAWHSDGRADAKDYK
jgi:hypothetical protein